MNTEKELLEKAAKAAGIIVKRNRLDDPAMQDMLIVANRNAHSSFIGWNPLTDDGDALRLAVKCNLWIGQHDDGVTVSDAYGRFKGALEEDYGGDPYAATRRAIVRAAAEIGKTL